MSQIMQLVKILEDRAAWLKREWEAGGDYAHLWTRREEVLYVLTKIKDLPSTSETSDEQGCEHCGSIEINPKCPACNGIERDA